MLKKLFEYFGHLFLLGEATRDNKAEIKEIRRELRDLSLVVQRLNREIHGLREENRQQKEIFCSKSKTRFCAPRKRCLAPNRNERAVDREPAR
jgi:hypothetical protein